MKQEQVIAIHYRNLGRQSALKGLPIDGERKSSLVVGAGSPDNDKSLPATQIGMFLSALLVAALLIALGATSYHVVAAHAVLAGKANRSEQGSRLNDQARLQLETDLGDSNLTADIATMRTFQTALTDELGATNQRLKSDPRDQTFLKRKQLIEMLLTNAGRTGVNDQLAAIENARRMMASRAISTHADEATVRNTMANLRNGTASWKTGPFANAGKLLGLRWEEGKGLANSTPYIWEESGWTADPGLR